MTKRSLVTAVSAVALVVVTPVSASAHSNHHHPKPPSVTTVSTHVAAPFNLAFNRGSLFVADGGTSTVSKVRGDGSLRTIAEGPQPGDVAGLDFSANGRYLAYTSTSYGPGGSALNILGPHGSRRTVDLSTHESTVNPDQNVHYGVDNPSQCVTDAIQGIPDGPPATYTGLIDSHPYSVAANGKGWIVADAGGNDLLKVDRLGNIRTLSVLPRQPYTFTEESAGNLGLDPCVIGVTYNFEAVPTDIEVGRYGWLYVSTLAGGPEDPSLGARSSVYAVNPRTGTAKLIASGLSGATNIALGDDGSIYVAELFGGQISKVDHGRSRTYVELPGALSVESGRHGLYAGTMGGEEGPGSIVRIR